MLRATDVLNDAREQKRESSIEEDPRKIAVYVRCSRIEDVSRSHHLQLVVFGVDWCKLFMSCCSDQLALGLYIDVCFDVKFTLFPVTSSFDVKLFNKMT